MDGIYARSAAPRRYQFRENENATGEVRPQTGMRPPDHWERARALILRVLVRFPDAYGAVVEEFRRAEEDG